MRYQVVGADGQSVQVDAVDWMMAMSQAIALMGIEVQGWLCNTLPDGRVSVMDPMTGASWTVSPIAASAPAAAATPAPPPVSAGLMPGPAPQVAAPTRPTAPRRAPAPPSMRPTMMWSIPPKDAPEEPASPAPDDLAEQLFDLSTDLFMAENPNAACRMALDLLMQMIPCEAGSVLRGTRKDGQLTFVAVAGPAASQLIGKKMSLSQGVVGASFDLGITIMVHDVSQDERHLARFDQETGFDTRSVLCVPVRQQYNVFGVLELINPVGEFQDWHVQALETVAQSLSTLLGGR